MDLLKGIRRSRGRRGEERRKGRGEERGGKERREKEGMKGEIGGTSDWERVVCGRKEIEERMPLVITICKGNEEDREEGRHRNHTKKERGEERERTRMRTRDADQT